MPRIPAIEAHKQAIRDKFNSGIGVYPFAVLEQYTYELWQKGNDAKKIPPHGDWSRPDIAPELLAHDLLWSADVRGRPNTGISHILSAFEDRYEAHPHKARQALKVLLACPVEEGYDRWKQEKKAEREEILGRKE